MFARFVLPYPCKALMGLFLYWCVQCRTNHLDLFLFWLSRNHLFFVLRKVSTDRLPSVLTVSIRLMNAVSWRYPLALRIRSFSFYIPHKRPKLGGHSYFHRLFWEHPRIERQGFQCDVVTVRLVIIFTTDRHPPHPWHPFNGVVLVLISFYYHDEYFSPLHILSWMHYALSRSLG